MFVAQGIHWLPETGVAVSRKLAFFGQLLHRVTFPDRAIVFNIVKYFRLQHKETTVYPWHVATCWFFLELVDFGCLRRKVEGSETARLLYGSKCSQCSLFFVV